VQQLQIAAVERDAESANIGNAGELPNAWHLKKKKKPHGTADYKASSLEVRNTIIFFQSCLQL